MRQVVWLLAAALAPAAASAAPWADACNVCPPGARWRDEAVIHVDVPRDLLSSSLAYDLRDAARVWEAGPCIVPSVVVGTQTETSYEVDGVSSVVFVETPPEIRGDESVIAATCNRCDAEGFIVEADIALFGPASQWNDNCLSPQFSQRGVLLHEVGHVLGLQHSEGDGGSVMAGLVSADRSQRFGSPGASDFVQLCDLYGALPAASAFASVEPGCSEAYARAGEPCGAAGPVPAGLLCVDDDAGAVWRWVCDSSQPCESGASCGPIDAAADVGVCEPLSPMRDAKLGARCEQDADCASGLCFAGAGEKARCLEACGPSLRCGGECVDVVKDAAYRGRWCLVPEPVVASPQPLLGCSTAAGPGWGMAALAAVLLIMRRRARAIRLASRGAAP